MRPVYQLTQAPESEPITVGEALAFLRVDSAQAVEEVTALLAVAREFIEQQTGRAILTQQWKRISATWPAGCGYDGRTIALERTPLVSVESVKYYPVDGSAQATLGSSTYHVLTAPEPGLVVLRSDADWPELFDRPDAVEINFTAGAASAANVPKTLRHAVLLLLSHLYDNRGPVNIGNIVNEIPFSLRALIESNRVGGFIA